MKSYLFFIIHQQPSEPILWGALPTFTGAADLGKDLGSKSIRDKVQSEQLSSPCD